MSARWLVGLMLALSTPALAENTDSNDILEKSAPEVSPNTALSGGLVLRVDDREAAIQQAILDAEALGGWFQDLGKDHVSLRVPAASARAFLESQRRHGDLLDRSYSAQDLGGQMRDLEGLLVARRGVLLKYLTVLDSASAKSVVSVEREITRLVQQIEQAEGQLRVLNDRARYARIDLRFQFRERRAPQRTGNSSFVWLNTMNVADMLGDFQRGVRRGPSGAKVPTPAGFAPWRNSRRFQAVSPDGVQFRVRTEKNKPRAALGFWSEALRTRMTDAGYTVIAEAPIEAAGGKGALLELGAANGPRDQTYLMALFVKNGKLIIAEATGEAEQFRGHRDALVAAIQKMDW